MVLENKINRRNALAVIGGALGLGAVGGALRGLWQSSQDELDTPEKRIGEDALDTLEKNVQMQLKALT